MVDKYGTTDLMIPAHLIVFNKLNGAMLLSGRSCIPHGFAEAKRILFLKALIPSPSARRLNSQKSATSNMINMIQFSLALFFSMGENCRHFWLPKSHTTYPKNVPMEWNIRGHSSPSCVITIQGLTFFNETARSELHAIYSKKMINELLRTSVLPFPGGLLASGI